jgi:hypothetical protein
LSYLDKFLVVEDAPDPTDVYWMNLEISTEQKIFRRIVGYLLSSIVLMLCCGAVYYLTAM